jgi:hypothetical protein
VLTLPMTALIAALLWLLMRSIGRA